MGLEVKGRKGSTAKTQGILTETFATSITLCMDVIGGPMTFKVCLNLWVGPVSRNTNAD